MGRRGGREYDAREFYVGDITKEFQALRSWVGRKPEVAADPPHDTYVGARGREDPLRGYPD